ncbi:EF-hand domain-containing protein [Sphingomonas sp. TX0543]|uniref:EF-hand domain-containing protein n=1 Tax=unclassified Sphingomonas TaxID=196159 RepID=UPI001485A925|nr:EF-hand domain-containing protein [Sphingomonas sp. 3P27F8]
MFRISILTATLMLGACATDRPPPPRHDGGPGHHRPNGDGQPHYLFISPMGEPFRVAHPEKAWFDAADANHDGRIDRAEFRADAMRFFKVLDRNADGEIDPDEIDIYETRMVPEIRVRDAGAARGTAPAGGRSGGGHGGGRGGGGGRRGGGFGGEGGEASGGTAPRPAREDRQGAARWSYLSLPEPVTAADTNFNRGIDPGEFMQAADQRFILLDRNGDGFITESELPAIDTHVRGGYGGPRGDHPFHRPPQQQDDRDEDRAPPPGRETN